MGNAAYCVGNQMELTISQLFQRVSSLNRIATKDVGNLRLQTAGNVWIYGEDVQAERQERRSLRAKFS